MFYHVRLFVISELDYPGKRTNGKGSYGTYFVRADREYLLLVVLSLCVCMKVYLHWSRTFRLSMVVCSWHRIASVVVQIRDGTPYQETGGWKLMVRSVRKPACAFQGGKGGSTATLLTGVMFQRGTVPQRYSFSLRFYERLHLRCGVKTARTALLPAKIPYHDLPHILTFVHHHAVNLLPRLP